MTNCPCCYFFLLEQQIDIPLLRTKDSMHWHSIVLFVSVVFCCCCCFWFFVVVFFVLIVKVWLNIIRTLNWKNHLITYKCLKSGHFYSNNIFLTKFALDLNKNVHSSWKNLPYLAYYLSMNCIQIIYIKKGIIFTFCTRTSANYIYCVYNV